MNKKAMQNKIIFHILPCLLVILTSLGMGNAYRAQAQQLGGIDAPQCTSNAQEIVNLREPLYKTAMVWDTPYGADEGFDQINDVALAPRAEGADKHYIIIGDYIAGIEGKTLSPFMARVDQTGKVIWEQRQKESDTKTAQRMVRPSSEDYAVLGEIRSSKNINQIYVARFGAGGKRIFERVFQPDVGFNMQAGGLSVIGADKGFMVAATQIARGEKSDRQIAVLYRLNNRGQVVWRKEYSPGLKTSFNAITPHTEAGVMVAGQIEQEDGRMAAWLLKIDDDGAIGWQRQYPRGQMARIEQIHFVPKGDSNVQGNKMVLVGTASPLAQRGASARAKTSAWVMQIDEIGAPVWERYYGGNYIYQGRAISVAEDGRMSVLLDATPAKARQVSRGGERMKGHATLLTLDPRGLLINSESFSDGQHAHGTMMIKGFEGERIIAGSLQGVVPDGMSAAQEPSVFDGWLFAATSLDPYDDPCAYGGF